MQDAAQSPVVVLSSGRAGSTVLVRLLNCLPRTIVWGEHGGFLTPFLQSLSQAQSTSENEYVRDARTFLPPVLDRKPIGLPRGMSLEWLNWFSEKDLADVYRRALTEMFYPEQIRDKFSRWGFKEIRYREFEYSMLLKLFPTMHTIILFRDPTEVCSSQFKSFLRGNKEHVSEMIKLVQNFFAFAAARADAQSKMQKHRGIFFLSYDRLVIGFDETVAELEEVLGEKFAIHLLQELRDQVRHWSLSRPPRPALDAEQAKSKLIEWASTAEIDFPITEIDRLASNYGILRSALRSTGPDGSASLPSR